MLWTVQHLVQQNVGILLLYRKEDDAQVSRTLEALTLQISGLIIVSEYLYRKTFHPTGDALTTVTAAASVAVLLLGCYYLHKLALEVRSGKSLNIMALAFWFIAMLMWIPLLAGPVNFFVVMTIPLFVHWCQYIGLNAMVTMNKYASEENRDKLIIQSISPILLFILVCMISALILTSAGRISSGNDDTAVILQGFIIGASLCHYFQDAFIWRFREPFLRAALLPYVRGIR